MRFSIKTILVLLTIIALTVWAVLGIRETFSIRTGENFDRVNWLPASASKVSFYRNYHFTAYQFCMPENEFIEWCPKMLNEIVEPVTISTWKTRLLEYPTPNTNTTADEFDRMIAKFKSETTATISNGLYYEKWGDDGGCSAYVFDRDTSIGYHQWSPR